MNADTDTTAAKTPNAATWAEVTRLIQEAHKHLEDSRRATARAEECVADAAVIAAFVNNAA